MPNRHPDARTLDELRARVAAIEGIGGPGGETDAAALGLPAVDRALPWGGLPRGCLHEITAPHGAAAAGAGIAAAFAARLAAGRPVMWIGTGLPPYLPGLLRFGLAPGRLLLVRPRRTRDVPWAAEEALACPELGALWVEHRALGFAASRRLQLAAADGGVSCLFVRPASEAEALPPSAAVTRWRAAPVPGAPEPSAGGLGAPRWRLALLRGRGAKPRNWIVEWDDATDTFALAAPAGDRPDRQAAA